MRDVVTQILLRIALGICVAVAVLCMIFYRQVNHFIDQAVAVGKVVALVLVALIALKVLLSIGRFIIAPASAKRHYPRMFRCRLRWRWLTRNLGLAYPDPHKKIVHRGAIGPAMGPNTRVEYPKGRIRYPRAKFRADPFGIFALVKTTPRAGRIEFEKQAVHIADSWQCVRVQVSQPKAGRLVVRGIVKDPLAIPYGPEAVPDAWSNPNPVRPYVGRDEWGTHRYADLKGVTGISIAGLPDFGKTSLVLSLLCQMATTGAVQFVVIDGKGGGDYLGWVDRSWIMCDGTNLEQAAGTWGTVENLMNRRLAAVGTLPGPRNRWHIGPTPEYPLIVTVADECHTYFDLEAARGQGKQAETYVRQCRGSAGELVRKGRSVLMLSILITQKQTSDANPTAIRDNCRLGFSFAVKTRDAAVAGLGEHIKEYPSYCPTALQEPAYVGVCTSSLRTGADPFVRLRVPEISEAAADARAYETEHLRTDPVQLLDDLLVHPVSDEFGTAA